MKKFLKLLPAILLVMFAPAVFAGTSHFDALETRPTQYDSCAFSVVNSSGTVIWCVDGNGYFSKAGGATRERTISLPLLGFFLGDAVVSPGTTAATSNSVLKPLSAGNSNVIGWSTSAGYPTIGWPFANVASTTGNLVQMFRLPQGYSPRSGGFRVLATQVQSGSQVNFDVWVQKNSTSPPTTYQVATQVSVTFNNSYTISPQVITLIPKSEAYWNAAVAGDWVQFRMWKSYTPLYGQATTHFLGVDFYYTPNN